MRYIVIARDGTDPEAKARRLAIRPAQWSGSPRSSSAGGS